MFVQANRTSGVMDMRAPALLASAGSRPNNTEMVKPARKYGLLSSHAACRLAERSRQRSRIEYNSVGVTSWEDVPLSRLQQASGIDDTRKEIKSSLCFAIRRSDRLGGTLCTASAYSFFGRG